MEFKLRRTRNPIRADRYVGIAGEPLLDITNRTMLVCTGNGPKSKMINGGGFIKSPAITSIPTTFPSNKNATIPVGVSFSSILFAALSTEPYIRLVFIHSRGTDNDQITGYVKPTVSSSSEGSKSLSFTENDIKWYDAGGTLDTDFIFEKATVYAQFVFPDGGVSQIDYHKDGGRKVASYGNVPEGMITTPIVDPANMTRELVAPDNGVLLDLIKYGTGLGTVYKDANGDTSIAGNTFAGSVVDYHLYSGMNICYRVGGDLYVSFDGVTHKSYNISMLLATAPAGIDFAFTAAGNYIYAYPASGSSVVVGSLDTTTTATTILFSSGFDASLLTNPKVYNANNQSSEIFFPYITKDLPTDLEVVKVTDGIVTSETISLNGGSTVDLYGITTCYYFGNSTTRRYGVLGYLDADLTQPAIWAVHESGVSQLATLPKKIENFQPGEDYDVLQHIKTITPNLSFLIEGYNQLIGFEMGGGDVRSVVTNLKDAIEFDGVHIDIDAYASPSIYAISGVDTKTITRNVITVLGY